MKFGASMFFTDYSMAPGELAQALEARGFESVWAPEHSHIPLSRKTPFIGGGELPKRYYDAMDPFVTLTAAAMADTPTVVLVGGSMLAGIYWITQRRREVLLAESKVKTGSTESPFHNIDPKEMN